MRTMIRVFPVLLSMLLAFGATAAFAQDRSDQSASGMQERMHGMDMQDMQEKMQGMKGMHGMQGMQGMQQGMSGYCPMADSGMPCPHCPKQTGMACPNCTQMQGSAHGMSGGMMMGGMDKQFYLDRRKDLDLDKDQIRKLIEIRSNYQAENIRTKAELQLAHMEVVDLITGEDWEMNQVEKLVRQIQELEGDMVLRHLQAKKEAQQVLTQEQRQKANPSSAGAQGQQQ